MKIAALTYDFPTLKTELGFNALVANGFGPELVIGAPRRRLLHYQSQLRATPRIESIHPCQLAAAAGAEYHVVPHDDPLAADLFRTRGIEVAVILGARILRKPIIAAATIGILNLHPGILPVNRGLDTVKWAILLDLPQGATAHLIDHRIDMGRIIETAEAPVYQDDTLVEISCRLQHLERHLMINALRRIASGERDFPACPAGEYRRSVGPFEELRLPLALSSYLHRLSTP